MKTKVIPCIARKIPGLNKLFLVLDNYNSRIQYLEKKNEFLNQSNNKLKSNVDNLNKTIVELQRCICDANIDTSNSAINNIRWDLNRLLNISLFSGNKSAQPNDLLRKGKIAVYTTIIENYDTLQTPISIENDFFDYYCITDNKKIESNFWNIIYFNKNDFDALKNINDATKISRYIKTHPHIFFKNYQHSLYVDANVIFLDKMSEWISTYTNNKDFLVAVHPRRICIYEEAKTCITYNKDLKENINKQISKYKDNNYPIDNGLTMNNVLYRVHSKQVQRLNEMWWEEILNNSKRDQISFCYCVNKLNFPLAISPLSAFSNRYYHTVNHV